MKIKINVLPDEQKKNRKIKEKIGAVLRFSFSIIFALLVLSAVFFIGELILKGDYELARQTSQNRFSQSAREVEQTEKSLGDMEIVSKKIKSISGEIPQWSRVLGRLSEICPQDVKISLVHGEKEHLKIGGFSKTREAFLAFQDELKSEGFINIISPPSNIVSPENFNFEIEADVKKDFLNKID